MILCSYFQGVRWAIYIFTLQCARLKIKEQYNVLPYHPVKLRSLNDVNTSSSPHPAPRIMSPKQTTQLNRLSRCLLIWVGRLSRFQIPASPQSYSNKSTQGCSCTPNYSPVYPAWCVGSSSLRLWIYVNNENTVGWVCTKLGVICSTIHITLGQLCLLHYWAKASKMYF